MSPFTMTVQSKTQGLASLLTETPLHPPPHTLCPQDPMYGGYHCTHYFQIRKLGPRRGRAARLPSTAAPSLLLSPEQGCPVLGPGGARLPELRAGQAADVSHALRPQGRACSPADSSTLSRLSNNVPARVLQESKNHCPMPNTLLKQYL